MNVLGLAQKIESEYGLMVGRPDLTKPLSESNMPNTRRITPDGETETIGGVLRSKFICINDVDADSRDVVDIYFCELSGINDSAKFMVQGNSALIQSKQNATQFIQDKSAFVSGISIDSKEI